MKYEEEKFEEWNTLHRSLINIFEFNSSIAEKSLQILWILYGLGPMSLLCTKDQILWIQPFQQCNVLLTERRKCSNVALQLKAIFFAYSFFFWYLRIKCWVSKGVKKMKSCNFCEKLWHLLKVVTFMKSCDFSKDLWILWKVVTPWGCVTPWIRKG